MNRDAALLTQLDSNAVETSRRTATPPPSTQREAPLTGARVQNGESSVHAAVVFHTRSIFNTPRNYRICFASEV